ncbi:hypothetical protein ARMSODRAFT_889358, partial [Armillaria solidipes]
LLDDLVEKWDLRWSDQNDGLALTSAEKKQNLVAKEENVLIYFDSDINSESSLTDRIQIFMAGWDICTKPAARCEREALDSKGPVTISVTYMDGSAYNNGTADTCAGAGVWFEDSNDRNIHI